MIEQLLQSLKDPSKRSYPLAILFIIFTLISVYLLYSLPYDLVYKGGMTDHGLANGVYLELYIVIGITFALGIAALNFAINNRKEVIVYKEKTAEQIAKQNEGTEQGGETIDVTSFRNAISSLKKEDEKLQTGLNQICKIMQAGMGALYRTETENGKRLLKLKAKFALALGETETIEFEFGEGLIGQCATSGTSLYLDEVPEGYINIVSGLGSAQPRYLFITPIKKGEVMGILELATFGPLSDKMKKQVEDMALLLAESLTGK